MAGSPTQVVSDLLRIDFACRDCSERPPDIVVQVLRTQESFQQHARVHGLPQGDTENACHCGDGRPCKQKLRREHTFWRRQLPTSGTPRVPAKAREAQYPGSATTSESSSVLKSQNPSSSVAGGGGTATHPKVCTESGILSGRSFAGEWQEHDLEHAEPTADTARCQ